MTNLKKELEQKAKEELSKINNNLLKHIKNSIVDSMANAKDKCEISIDTYSQYNNVINLAIDFLKEEDIFAYVKKETYNSAHYGEITNIHLIAYHKDSYEEGRLRYIGEKKKLELKQRKRYDRNLLISGAIGVACILLLLKYMY